MIHTKTQLLQLFYWYTIIDSDDVVATFIGNENPTSIFIFTLVDVWLSFLFDPPMPFWSNQWSLSRNRIWCCALFLIFSRLPMQLPCNVFGLWKTQTHSSSRNTFELEHADDTLTAYSSHSEQKFHSAFVMTTHSRSNSTTHERTKKNESMNCANDIDCSGAHHT